MVFVCHGNIMRSAYAAQVAKQRFPHVAHRVADGGTHATKGRPPQESALRVSREQQAPLDGHEATPMAMLALSPHDIVVCMDAMNEANVLAAFPGLAERVFRVGDIEAPAVTGVSGQLSQQGVSHDDREVRDPYGQGDASTRDAFMRIAQLVARWIAQAGAAERGQGQHN
jgi:protein-tyrosine-phosphatase